MAKKNLKYQTDEEKLAEYIKEYKNLDLLRRQTDDKQEKDKLLAKISRTDNKIAYIKNRMVITNKNIPIPKSSFERNMDVFSNSDSYRGPSTSGTSLGDGNYWKIGHW
jgi:hypothetical protein